MTSLPHLKRLVTKDFVLMATTMILLAAILLHDVHRIFLIDKFLSQLRTLRPMHILLATCLPIASVLVYYFICRPRTVYLVDYTCFKPSSNYRMPKATFLEHQRLSPLLADSTNNFISRVLDNPGLGEETCYPHVLHYIEPYCSLDEARTESELVVFSVIDDLLAKTGVSLDAINVLITNCSVFCPMPSVADMVINRYNLRGDIRIINLSGMGCSAGVTAIGLAKNILKVIPWRSHALVVSTETLGPNFYAGNNHSMQLSNILFRMGGTAKLLSTSGSKARFRLAHVVRTTTAASDSAHRCVYQEEDGEGNPGMNLSKDLIAMAGDTLKANINAIGPLVLPASELLKFFLLSATRKVFLGRRIKPYIPDFRMAFEHFCIHVGGPAVINSVQHGLNLSDKHVEPSRMTMHRFGNQSSTSVWYELAYIEAKGCMHKGDRVLMIGLGAGYKCNTATWVCIKQSTDIVGPWAGCIHRYPVSVSKEGSIY